ncbi:hypothetical protein DTL42_01535 [Bremerella cremea]|uniref:Uncharacterized protein n=1 Tax=Bremerella cremea TaxID=1031537 RepID=A0A368KU77_9BACT|nr:hypothetical protein [Bremerella cremea]RCS53876.1 hypothetical protein DTL42_01535 [Bremerella cremea]
MAQDELQDLQRQWLEVKQQLDNLPAAEEAFDEDTVDLEASLQQRLDELEFEIALRQRGGGPCSLM